MRILLPLKVDEYVDLDTGVISGGIIKFGKQIYDNIPGVIPVQITKADRQAKRSRAIITEAIHKYSPDMAIGNEIDYLHNGYFQEYNIPLVTVLHEPLGRDIRFLELGSRMFNSMEKGAHVYFVSERQHSYFQDFFKSKGTDLPAIKGYINSSYCEEDLPYVSDREISAITVGRNDATKDPFWLHKKAGGLIDSTVITNNPVYEKENANHYVEKNRHWESPQNTIFHLPHREVLDIIAKSKAYVSTCPVESWGITALEALSCGVPLLIATDKTGEHSSTGIAADASHYVTMPKSASATDVVDVIQKLGKFSDAQRFDIANMTREKHSKHNWVNNLMTIVDHRMDDKPKNVSTLADFF